MNGPTHSRRLISGSIILLLAISVEAATVWNGPTISFTKANYANPLLAENQDRLTTNVWITRGSSQGLFNAKTESRFTHYFSPAGTEWANGSLENYATLSYTNWNQWARGVNSNPYATVGVQAVLHLIAEDIYLAVRFTSWSGGAPGGGPTAGGGFSYLRSTPVPEATNAVPNVTWQQPANNAAFPPGFTLSLRARATDSDGTVSNVNFFATPTNGAAINVGPGTLASDGYYISGWTNPPPGQYQLHAEAVDNTGGRGISDSVLIVVVGTNQEPTNAQTRTWTGADPSGNWSAPANWSPSGVLVNGDALVFPGGLPPGDMVSTNDFTDRVFRSITFNGASRHTIRGNPITLTNRRDCIINTGTNVIACDLTFSATPSPSTFEIPRIASSSFDSGELTVIGNVGADRLHLGLGFWRLVIMGQFTGGSLFMDWYTTLALYGDNPYAVAVTNVAGNLSVQGSQPNLNVALYYNQEDPSWRASLGGNGLVGDVADFGLSRITPDPTLSVKNINGGNLLIRLNGTNAGEYSRLIASGNVSLSRGSLVSSAGFNPQAGQVFTIVEKTSTGPTANAFLGPEGTVTNLNGMPFRISYVGGDGNDVTLTVEALNTPPNVTITSPPAGVVFTAPASFLLEASASDPDGSVTNVQFFRDVTFLGNDTSSPYSVSVSGLVAGNYTLSAVASDNRGLRATNSLALIVRNNSNSNCVAVPSGLVAWWRAEGDADDATGVHDGELLFGAAFAQGRVGQAFSFSGVRSRVNIPDSDAFKLTDSLSFEGWIQAASWSPGIIFIRGDNRGGLDPYHMSLSSSGHLQWGIGSADNIYVGVNDPNTLPIGVWTHVAGVLNGANGSLSLYVNGSLVSQTTTGLRPLRDLDPNHEPAVGIGNAGGTLHDFAYHGLIDEWSLYGRALSGEEILEIYQAGSLDKCAINPRPGVTTLASEPLTATSARLTGRVNPHGWPATVWFEWGPSLAYGNVTPTQSVGSGTNLVGFSNVIGGLVSETEYHYRARASNAFGFTTGMDQTFNLSNYRPVATTLASDQLTLTSARLKGQVNPRGWPTTAWFEWGTDTNYGNVIGMQDVGQGSSVSNLNVVLDGLMAGPTYHYRLVATNAFGTVYGANQTFGLGFVPIPIPGLPGGFSGSVAWGDYDNDGRLDFLITGQPNGPNFSQLWRNTGSGFSNVTASVAPGLPGVAQGSVAWGDYDNDGRLDFLLTGAGISQLWRNTGSGFSNVTASVAPGLPVGFSGFSAAWGDYDNDSRLDFLLTGGGASNTSTLWRNTGSGFSNVTASVAPGVPAATAGSVAWGDYDNDGRLDFLLAGISQLWRNTGNGFSNVTASVAPGLLRVFNGSGAWGDYDNDGRLDFLLTSTFYGSQLWRNTGSGFSNVTASVAPGLPARSSVAWGDYDNDGRLDFLLSGTSNGVPPQLWRNTGGGFSNVTASVAPGLPGVFNGFVAWGDYDNDGRLDFLLTSYGTSQLWRNNLPVASNAPPAAPTGLSSTLSGSTVSLIWNPPVDDQTPSAGLNYNLRIGTTPGASDVLAPMAQIDGLRLLPVLGNAQAGTNAVMSLPFGQYYWSVQAVDTSFAGSPFAAEQQFTVAAPRIIEPLWLANGQFQFSFSNQSSAVYEVLGTTNLALPLAQWTVLGPPVSLGGGLYRFMDTGAPGQAQRFYILRAWNTSE